MCNRYSAARRDQIAAILKEQFGIDLPADWHPSYNIAPTSRVPVAYHDGAPKGALLPWGTPSPMGLILHARAETITEKPLWKSAAAHGRCLLPTDGFFEWEDRGKRKQGHYFTVRGRDVFYFAGLRLPATEKDPDRCVMVTSPSNAKVSPFIDRMPAILDDDAAREWLGEAPLPAGRIQEIVRPFPADRMNQWLAPPTMNNARYQEPDAIRPWEPEPELF